ncbi:hypothetical protein [Clavibacter michiganensis]|uniref:hypothetical protein n=2 Tax=Clavibacter michiganensis TaxID=28447 RepID=UPI001FF13C86|nr:hypothetical protein [Clavibacter michiganensis]MDO4030440.1 hypothetical protein [Clavibacter michiganensis]MDO4045900.1 hypothetical protein [Clavibacter michiganensis]MDO4054766.1 hypothetical protein [Clavibacter michiganensis]MDO4058118.1 hypothetical protein [Clavibacter michiganensis]UOW05324.1 hypothetical protein MU580_15875 [Clavibacter michiganensis subsp. michiganensis]
MNISEHDRFWRYVVKGPEPDDCWLWTGAVSDDGYGRFWVPRESGGQRTVRPTRFAFEEMTGVIVPSSTLLLHACDVPLCVHVDHDPQRSHLTPGTHRENMLDRAQKGRHVNQWTAVHYRGLPRAERVRRSRELRDAVRDHGWDRTLIHRALNGIDPDQPMLW